MVLNTHGIGRKQTSILHVVHATEIATIMKFTKSLPSLTVATNRETLKQVFCISWSQSLGKLLHRMSKYHVLFPHEVFGLSVIRLKQDCAIVKPQTSSLFWEPKQTCMQSSHNVTKGDCMNVASVFVEMLKLDES